MCSRAAPTCGVLGREVVEQCHSTVGRGYSHCRAGAGVLVQQCNGVPSARSASVSRTHNSSENRYTGLCAASQDNRD